MSEYKIELVLKTGHTIIGDAIDEGTALNVMEEATAVPTQPHSNPARNHDHR